MCDKEKADRTAQASDVETAISSRSDSKDTLSPISSLESTNVDSCAALLGNKADRNANASCLEELFCEAFSAILRDHTERRDAAELGDAKAFLARVLGRIGKADCRETACLAMPSVDPQQPANRQPLVPKPALDLLRPSHSPHVKSPQSLRLSSLQPAGVVCGSGNNFHPMSLHPLSALPSGTCCVTRMTPYPVVAAAPHAVAVTAAAAATSAATAAAVSSATGVAALLSTPRLNAGSMCHSISTTTITTTTVTTTTATSCIAMTPRVH